MDTYESPVNSIPETGSLTARAPEESHFIGSSSGVYFINTVKRAFDTSSNEAASSRLPAAEETVGGEEDLLPSRCVSPDARPNLRFEMGPYERIEVSTLGRLGSLPSRDVAQQLAVLYFKHWHPLFPFLSGPRFLQNLNALHDEVRLVNQGGLPVDRQRLCSLVMFQCVFNIGAAHMSATDFPQSYRISSPTDLLSMVGSLASRHDLQTIQAALAAQLFCVSTMALRTASSLGSLLVKLMMHAGLHRCPFRYGQLSDEDRSLRKRIFWSAYALDRYLSQALGLPLTISDTDIDVCMPTWIEMHSPAQEHLADRVNSGQRVDSTSPGQPRPEPVHAEYPLNGRGERGGQVEHVDASNSREIALARYVEYGRLLGRALELYHKSIHVRSVDHSKVLFLRSDVDHWFNNLPTALQTVPLRVAGAPQNESDHQLSRFSLFFTVLYHQLIILINRPSLSLHRSLPEFQSGMQITLSAARATIAALEQQEHLFWPGYLASVWMSGLIISFACQVRLYDTAKGSQEVIRCQILLESMAPRWPTAQKCHTALAALLRDPLFDRNAIQHAGLQRTNTYDHSYGRPSHESLEDGRPAKRPRAQASQQNAASPSQHHGYPVSDLRNDWRSLPDLKSGTGPGQIPVDASATNLKNGTWDMNDIFQDVSWESLFGNNEEHLNY